METPLCIKSHIVEGFVLGLAVNSTGEYLLKQNCKSTNQRDRQGILGYWREQGTVAM